MAWHQGTAHSVAGAWGVGRGGGWGGGGGRGLACSCSSASSSTPRPRIRLPLRPPPAAAAASPVSALVSAAPASASLPRLFMPPPRRLPPAEEGRAVEQACGETAAVASRVLLAKPHRACRCRPPPPRPRAAQLRQRGQLGPRRRRAARPSAGWRRRPRLAAQLRRRPMARPRRHRLCHLPCACPCRDPVVGAAGAPQRGRRWPTPRRTGLRASRMPYAEAGARA